MDEGQKASLLWGLIGGLSYLVLIQAYHLLTGEFVGWLGMGGIALAVFVLTTLFTHWLRPRVASWNERP